jgi:hypothetical protein
MSGGGGGIIIIGDESLVDQLIANKAKVAPFRLTRMLKIIDTYNTNENAITRDEQQFLFRCAADVVDNS